MSACSSPEDLAGGEAGAVVDGRVDVAVAGKDAPRPLGLAVHAPAAAGWDSGDLLHVDVNELTRALALVATRRLLGARGSVTTIESAQPHTAKNGLDRRRGDADLVRDPVGAPPAKAAQMHHPPPTCPDGPVRRAPRTAGTVQQSDVALALEADTPLAHGLGIDLEPLCGGLDRPAPLQDTPHPPPATSRGQHRVRMLASSANHESSLRDVSSARPTTSQGGSLHWWITHPIPPGTTSPHVTARKRRGALLSRCGSARGSVRRR